MPDQGSALPDRIYGTPIITWHIEFRLSHCGIHGDSCTNWVAYGDPGTGVEVPLKLRQLLADYIRAYPRHEWRIVCTHAIMVPLESTHYIPPVPDAPADTDLWKDFLKSEGWGGSATS